MKKKWINKGVFPCKPLWDLHCLSLWSRSSTISWSWKLSRMIHESKFLPCLVRITFHSSLPFPHFLPAPVSSSLEFPLWASPLCSCHLLFSIPSAFHSAFCHHPQPTQPHCTRWLHFMQRMYSWRPPIIQNLHNSSLLFPQDWIESTRRREMNLEEHKSENVAMYISFKTAFYFPCISSNILKCSLLN